MEGGRYDGEWQQAAYRRGRFRPRRECDQRSPSPHYRRQLNRERPSYASVTRMKQSWDYPQRYKREPGFQPQFFEHRWGYERPPRTQPYTRDPRDTNNRAAQSTQQRAYYNRVAQNNQQRTNTAPRTRNSRRKRRRVAPITQQHTNTAPRPYDRRRDADEPKSDDPDFGQKVRIMHKAIKVAHHLKIASADQAPPTIKRLADHLATFIKPAVPTEGCVTLLEGNARVWLSTTMGILRDHYTEAMENELQKLTHMATRDWQEPFQVACSWARRNLGRRLQQETLEQTEALIVDRLGNNGGVGEIPQPPEAVTQTPQLQTRRVVSAEIHAPPVERAASPEARVEQETEDVAAAAPASLLPPVVSTPLGAPRPQRPYIFYFPED